MLMDASDFSKQKTLRQKSWQAKFHVIELDHCLHLLPTYRQETTHSHTSHGVPYHPVLRCPGCIVIRQCERDQSPRLRTSLLKTHRNSRAMDAALASNDSDSSTDAVPALYVGQHESQRISPVTVDLLYRAQDANYDILTVPVTTPHFQSRVLGVLSSHAAALAKSSLLERVPLPLITPLTPDDTDLAPNNGNGSLVAATSAWIDLGSPDPLISHVSKQILNLEVAYAAFCGINNVLLPGPLGANGSDTTQFARAVMAALALGPYIQLHLLMPMTAELEQDQSVQDVHLCELVRDQYQPEETDAEDDGADENSVEFESWEAWDAIRMMCNYSTRLSIGEISSSASTSSHFLHQSGNQTCRSRA